ncbi:MAG: tRNA 2-thiouridine(34) synthase MnmA [Oscillospiraceae bacterium]|nr:tRNA 2-thiouridine(34) synthase MnmA [Oscillospiraceae bacterium]
MRNILVGMSGGVDSAAAAALLCDAGYNVTGVTLLLHGGGAEDCDAARAVCERLGIPHRTLDLSQPFCQNVKDYFVKSYCCGETPNPCIECNRTIKFGAMLDFALANGFDGIATGHYARTAAESDGTFSLLRGADTAKDQSYVLYTLTQHQLSHLLLPLGEYTKEQVRGIAAARGFSNADRADSQDICFVPDGDYVRFLRDYGGVTPGEGDFIDTATGKAVGRHKGLVCYTRGQRKGLGIGGMRPLYVLEKDAQTNTVRLGDDIQLYTRTLSARGVNWIGGEPTQPLRVTAKARYTQKEAPCAVRLCADGTVEVVFDEPQRAVTAGQSVVFYAGERVLGGGVIDKTW